jgi:hypothetical protein
VLRFAMRLGVNLDLPGNPLLRRFSTRIRLAIG